MNKLRIGNLFTERYELFDKTIICHIGLFRQLKIDAQSIEGWAVFPEMGFDFVKIAFINGKEVLLIDNNNDLINALKIIAGDREIGSAIDRL